MEANIEYRVRPVTRYVITKYESTINEDGSDAGAMCRVLGEHDNEYVAQEVAYALCKADHERLGYAPGDMRIKYPSMKPTPTTIEPVTSAT